VDGAPFPHRCGPRRPRQRGVGRRQIRRPKAGSGHPSPGSGTAAGGCGSAGPARARRRRTTAARWRLSVAHPGAEAADAWGSGGVAGPCAEAAGAWGNGGVASPCADAARQRPLNAAATPPLTRSPRPADGSPRRSDRGSPVCEQPLGSVGCLPRQPGLGGGLASVAEQPGCQRGGQVKCGGRTMGAPVRSGSATGSQMAVQRELAAKWDPSRSWGTMGPTKTNKIYIFKKLSQCNKKIFTWQREPLTCRVPWTRGYPKHSGHAGTRLGCLDSRGPRQGHEHTLSTGLSWETRTRCVANSTKVVFDCVGWNLGTLP
uniref:Uncharacterized protein n=1 Tax=Oryza glaberrima TaxID=4538 RepID=I1PXA6_ORYGL